MHLLQKYPIVMKLPVMLGVDLFVLHPAIPDYVRFGVEIRCPLFDAFFFCALTHVCFEDMLELKILGSNKY